MSFSPEFMAFLKKNDLLYLLDELDGEERWVYRDDSPEKPFLRDIFGRLYINRAYDLAEAHRREKKAKRRGRRNAES